MIAVHRHRPRGVQRLGVRCRPLVTAEEVPGPVARRDLPVLLVVVTVPPAGQPLDLRVVIALQPPRTGRLVLDQLGRPAAEHESGVVVAPAQVAGLVSLVVRRLAVYRRGVIGARDEPPLDVPGRVQAPPVTDLPCLVVRRCHTSVDRPRVIGQRDFRLEPARCRRRAHRVRPGETARLLRDLPRRRRRQRRRRPVAARAGSASLDREHGGGTTAEADHPAHRPGADVDDAALHGHPGLALRRIGPVGRTSGQLHEGRAREPVGGPGSRQVRDVDLDLDTLVSGATSLRRHRVVRHACRLENNHGPLDTQRAGRSPALATNSHPTIVGPR
ncbi:hypothetical protein ISCU110981_03840 [Isoptericola cucumis]